MQVNPGVFCTAPAKSGTAKKKRRFLQRRIETGSFGSKACVFQFKAKRNFRCGAGNSMSTEFNSSADRLSTKVFAGL